MPFLPFLLALLPQAVHPAQDAKSKDPEVRLGAAREMASSAAAFEKELLEFLGDEDWEVREVAAAALGSLGKSASKAAFDELLDTALEGPVWRLRRIAGESLAKLDGRAAYEKLVKRIKGDEAVPALEAIALLGSDVVGWADTSPLSKQLGEKVEPVVRRAAARALVRLDASSLRGLMKDADLALRAAAIEAAGETDFRGTSELLFASLADPGLADVLTRRCFRSLQGNARLRVAQEAQADLESLIAAGAKSKEPVLVERVARLVGLLVDGKDGSREITPEFAREQLAAILAGGEPAARAAAASSLGRVGGDEVVLLLEQAVAGDESARVRHVALVTLSALRAEREEAFRKLAAERLVGDDAARVRVAAAVELAVVGATDVVEPLSAALGDADWRVAVTAAVSLGITELVDGAPPLIALYSSEDWKRRGGAIAGLARLRAKQGVPTILAALEDDEPLVRRTALELLRSISGEDLVPERKAWQAWWTANEDRVRLSVPEEVKRRRAELEYVDDPARIFEGLDMVVLESRGDRIESVLAFLGLECRLTRSAQVIQDALHPDAVFVSNCTGEVLADELERIAWFVHAGGALLGSCWALEETIARALPGYVRRLPTRGQVLDDVPAYATDPASPWLAGAFPTGVRPIYHLEGAYLIEVLEPELVEVLVDSPECAAAWGDGNLAAWFRAGHGVVLDSVNHFDLQGLATAIGLKKPEDRMAYAVDHLGLSYADLRAQRGESFWKRLNTTAQRIKDLSVFRLVTNFVRAKRVGF